MESAGTPPPTEPQKVAGEGGSEQEERTDTEDKFNPNALDDARYLLHAEQVLDAAGLDAEALRLSWEQIRDAYTVDGFHSDAMVNGALIQWLTDNRDLPATRSSNEPLTVGNDAEDFAQQMDTGDAQGGSESGADSESEAGSDSARTSGGDGQDGDDQPQQQEEDETDGVRPQAAVAELDDGANSVVSDDRTRREERLVAVLPLWAREARLREADAELNRAMQIASADASRLQRQFLEQSHRLEAEAQRLERAGGRVNARKLVEVQALQAANAAARHSHAATIAGHAALEQALASPPDTAAAAERSRRQRRR